MPIFQDFCTAIRPLSTLTGHSPRRMKSRIRAGIWDISVESRKAREYRSRPGIELGLPYSCEC